ncbi:HAD family hydrolase [Calidifontibacillus erzurumensis]|uniref:HAD family hydrolase n=1 Tax=Calidifontibacillus erzurumensis TaxID=2741433 RepID=A0A8J8GBG8_9BACI|nr:HAD family hydrolase [Calidifontibacillus erzurumensis]NSL50850.1 HAD family hydrolase [Calidifontibacillus erzurumensis]
MIKMFVSDLDGTLLTIDNKVRDDDIEAINKALEAGIDICLASGRKDIDIRAVATMICPKWNEPEFYRISQNGAFIFSKNNEALHKTAFDPEIAREVYNRVIEKDVITIVSTIDKEYVEIKDETILRIEKRLFSPIEEEKNLPMKIGKTIQASKIIINGPEKRIRMIQEELQEAFPNELDTYISEAQILDVMPKNISKGNAVDILIKHIGINSNQIACIGDSFNDIPMFQITHNSFAMATAHDQVKRNANYIVETVAEAIEQVLQFQKN